MPKLKNLTVQNDPMERLAVNIHGSVYANLKSYREFYELHLGGKLELNYVVEEMLKTVMEEDKDYKAFLKAQETAQSSAPAAKPASKNVDDVAVKAAPANVPGDSFNSTQLN